MTNYRKARFLWSLLTFCVVIYFIRSSGYSNCILDDWITDVFSWNSYQIDIAWVCGHVTSLQNMFISKGKLFIYHQAVY